MELETVRACVPHREQSRRSHEFFDGSALPSREVIILGGGLTGLAAGYVLSKAGRRVVLLEGDSQVGGLSKTIIHDGFRFDLGGHRFITSNKKIEQFVIDLLKGDFLLVQRKSKIYMSKRYYDYPLRAADAIFGLSPLMTLQIILDYFKEKVRQIFRPRQLVSLEDWVVNRFGRKMFDLYFKQYSEKVWGIDCANISQEWVAQRIKGLSLWTAIKNALLRLNGKGIATFSKQFIYPPMGIGQISDRLQQGIEEGNSILTKTEVTQINHEDFMIKNVIARNKGHVYGIGGSEFVSTIPLTSLFQMLSPPPPVEILEAASQLKYRDIVIVTIMLDRERVTDNTWIYLPENEIPFGRVHEPANWSPYTAPKGKTHLVTEYFCSRDDEIWNQSDEELISRTLNQLEKLDFIHKKEVIGSCVIRASNAYPIYEVGYGKYYDEILNYLKKFKNLHISGRAGMFRYYNMDHAMDSGINVAEEILGSNPEQRATTYA